MLGFVFLAEPAASLLVRTVRYTQDDLRMPPKGKVADTDIVEHHGHVPVVGVDSGVVIALEDEGAVQVYTDLLVGPDAWPPTLPAPDRECLREAGLQFRTAALQSLLHDQRCLRRIGRQLRR